MMLMTAIIADNVKAEEKIFIISKSNLNSIRSDVLKISVLVLAWKLSVSSHHVPQLKLIVFKSLNNPPIQRALGNSESLFRFNRKKVVKQFSELARRS